jgi:hypothetical protein
MDDHNSRGSQLLANVVRDFVGSRLERQLLAQAFELAWHGSQSAGESGRLGMGSPRSGRYSPSVTASAAASSAAGV